MSLQIPVYFKSNFVTQPSFSDIKVSLEVLLLSSLKEHLFLSPDFFKDPTKWVHNHPEETAKCFCELNKELIAKNEIIYCVFTNLPKVPIAGTNIDLDNMFYALGWIMRELDFQNLRIVAEVEYKNRYHSGHYVFPTISIQSRTWEKSKVTGNNLNIGLE